MTEILMSPNVSGWALPRVDITVGEESLAEQLVAGVKSKYGLDSYSLLNNHFENSCADTPSVEPCAILETIRENDDASAGLRWLSVGVAISEETLPHAELSSIEKMFRYIRDPKMAPFTKPGWVKELLRWAEKTVEPIAMRLTGGFRQRSGDAICSLVRIETTGPEVWFKAKMGPLGHEFPVTVTMYRLFPRYVPRILAVHSAYNGWLAQEIPAQTLVRSVDIRAWIDTARALAELQTVSIGKTNQLLESGCRDLRLPQLADEVDPFFDRVRKFIRVDEGGVSRGDSKLSLLCDRLKAACAVLQKSGIPDTIGHLDFNPGNILVSQERCVFLDWAEACVSSPIITFEYLRENFKRRYPKNSGEFVRISAEYIRPWQSIISQAVMDCAFSGCPLVAVFAYAAGCANSHCLEGSASCKISWDECSGVRSVWPTYKHSIERSPES